jgi:hypothetical protein
VTVSCGQKAGRVIVALCDYSAHLVGPPESIISSHQAAVQSQFLCCELLAKHLTDIHQCVYSLPHEVISLARKELGSLCSIGHVTPFALPFAGESCFPWRASRNKWFNFAL